MYCIHWLPSWCWGIKNPPTSAGDLRDTGLIPGLGRTPGGRNGNPAQYSCLENPMDRGAWQAMIHRVTKSQIQLKGPAAPYVLFWSMHLVASFVFPLVFQNQSMFNTLGNNVPFIEKSCIREIDFFLVNINDFNHYNFHTLLAPSSKSVCSNGKEGRG